MNQNRIIAYAVSLVLVCAGFKASAQDPHFSQYFQAPMYTNPALTGQVNGNYRITALYRSQWNAFGNAFNTSSLSADFRKNEWGLGVTLIDEVSGPANFNTLSAMLSASYDISYASNSQHHFIVGVQAGIINNYFNDNDVTTPDQWDPVTGSSDGDLGENFGTLNTVVPDLNFGLLYFNGSSLVKLAPFAGLSVSHLTQPDYNFGGQRVPLPMRFLAHAGVRYRANSGLEITPHAKFIYQDVTQAYNGIIGANMSYALIDTETRLEAGIAYRIDDAIVPYVGILYKDFLFGVTFDSNVSTLSDIGVFKNAIEFSLTYTNKKQKFRQEFICPRL